MIVFFVLLVRVFCVFYCFMFCFCAFVVFITGTCTVKPARL